MKVLGVDTSTMMGAVGIVDGDELIAELRVNVAVTHSERLMLHIDGLLKSARLTLDDIEGFAVNVGPGSFTGLRIGLATVKGLAYATGRPVAGVGSLGLLAYNVPYSIYQVCPVLDARKKMVYAAVFKGTDWEREAVVPPCALTPDELVGRICEPTLFIGEGANVYREFIAQRLGGLAHFAPRALDYPSGAAVACLGYKEIQAGRASDPFTLVPSYIREGDFKEPA